MTLDSQQFEERFLAFRDALTKLTPEDLHQIAIVLDVQYSGPDPIFNPDGKQQFIKDLWYRLRHYRQADKRLTRVRDAWYVLKTEFSQ